MIFFLHLANFFASMRHIVFVADTAFHANVALAERLYAAGRFEIFTRNAGAACCTSG